MLLLGVCVLSLLAPRGDAIADFNDNNYPSDTRGSLPGMVLYVQNQIVPQTLRHQYDIEPHLTMHRHMLALFKPEADVSGVNITVELGNVTLVRTHMRPPDTLPGVIHSINVTFDPIESLVAGHTVAGGAVSSLSAARLAELVNQYAVVRVHVANGAWTQSIVLPDSAPAGRVVIVQRTSVWGVSVYGSGSSWAPGIETVQFKRGAQWASSMDLPHTLYRYGRFWWAPVPYPAVVPRMRITLSSGMLSSVVDPEVGSASELWVGGIELGMLTHPRGGSELMTDAFIQENLFFTLPLARITYAGYEPIQLPEVMMPWGELYTTADPSIGGVYSGNMRQQMAKSLVSQGFNAANYGISSSDGGSEALSPICAQFTAHWAVGMYSNGRVAHGLSGGGSIITLLGSQGYEVSHEFGHNFGLGHYPGGFRYTIHRRASQWGSTWGWQHRSNIFVPNFQRTVSTESTCYQGQCESPWQSPSGPLPWRWDCMDGTYGPVWASERFNLFTPYSMNSVQQFSETRAVFASSSPTGFVRWSRDEQRMVPYEHRVRHRDVRWMSHTEAQREDAQEYGVQLLSLYDVLRQRWVNGGWTRNFVVPDPSRCEGRFLMIESDASWDSFARINDEEVTVRNGDRLAFVAVVSRWVAVPQVDLDAPRVPERHRVPVTTLLGFYDAVDPPTRSSFVYPAFHGASGFVYPEDGPEARCRCRLVVDTEGAGQLTHCLSGTPFGASMNHFHVNVAGSARATKAAVFCGSSELASRTLELAKGTAVVRTFGTECSEFPLAWDLCREAERIVQTADVTATPVDTSIDTSIDGAPPAREGSAPSVTGSPRSVAVLPVALGAAGGGIVLLAAVTIVVLRRRRRHVRSGPHRRSSSRTSLNRRTSRSSKKVPSRQSRRWSRSSSAAGVATPDGVQLGPACGPPSPPVLYDPVACAMPPESPGQMGGAKTTTRNRAPVPPAPPPFAGRNAGFPLYHPTPIAGPPPPSMAWAGGHRYTVAHPIPPET